MSKYNLKRMLFQCAETFWAGADYRKARVIAHELGMPLDEDTTDNEVFSWLCRNEPNKQNEEDVDL